MLSHLKMLHSVAKVAKKAYKLPFFTFSTRRMVKIYFLHQIFWKALERPFKWHIGKFCSISRKNVTLHNRKSLTFCPIIVDLRHCDPDVQKSDSGFGPRDHYLATVGLNPAVNTSCSGFTPRDHHLATVGLNPYVHKSDSGFTPSRSSLHPEIII